MGTKGTWKRPPAISDAEVQARWDATFGRRHGRHVLLKDESVGFTSADPEGRGMVFDEHMNDYAGFDAPWER